MLHLHSARRCRPQTSAMGEKEFQVQTDLWYSSIRNIAATVPSLDFIGWHGEHYVVVRHSVPDGACGRERVELKELPARRRLDCAKGGDFGGEDAAWMERKDLPMDYESPGLMQQ